MGMGFFMVLSYRCSREWDSVWYCTKAKSGIIFGAVTGSYSPIRVVINMLCRHVSVIAGTVVLFGAAQRLTLIRMAGEYMTPKTLKRYN